MAAKVPGALRLLPEKWARVDAYARARGVSRQRVLESAVDSFLEDAQGGVPDLVVEEPEVKPAATRVPPRQQRSIAQQMGWRP